jgi:CelD/BcsL family acetyltransferase involved in cellulose biosynthesis
VLRAADGPIAASFSLVLDGTCFVLKIGYDEAFSPVAPGTVLIDELLQHAYAAGIHRVDLISDAEWHSRWHTASRGVYEVVVANYTPAGVLAFQMLRARELARPWVRRMRTALRRTDLCPPA